MVMPPDLAERHDDALTAARAVLHPVGTPDLPRPTPCRGWNLRTLTEHMIGQNEGFATAIAGGDADVTAYTPRPVADPAGLMQAWDESVGHLQAAVDAADPHQPVRLVEIARVATVPAAAAVGMHLLDAVVHTWDVATAWASATGPNRPCSTSSSMAPCRYPPVMPEPAPTRPSRPPSRRPTPTPGPSPSHDSDAVGLPDRCPHYLRCSRQRSSIGPCLGDLRGRRMRR